MRISRLIVFHLKIFLNVFDPKLCIKICCNLPNKNDSNSNDIRKKKTLILSISVEETLMNYTISIGE